MKTLLLVAMLEVARACITVSNSPVKMDAEETIIIWDDARKIEHFIRRVDFKTNGSDMAFLVPLPTKPEIAEADAKAFERVRALVPVPVAKGAANSSVKVLEEKRVAGMDVAVLEAESADALAKWLTKHKFSTRPALAKWLEPYTREKFKIAAFKYAGSGTGAGTIASKAVRISFETPFPYYPYKEADDAVASATRSLNVYLFAPVKAHGYTFSDGPGKAEWTAATAHSAEVKNPKELLAGLLPAEKIPETLWLTAFHDSTAKRPAGAELFFEKAP